MGVELYCLAKEVKPGKPNLLDIKYKQKEKEKFAFAKYNLKRKKSFEFYLKT